MFMYEHHPHVPCQRDVLESPDLTWAVCSTLQVQEWHPKPLVDSHWEPGGGMENCSDKRQLDLVEYGKHFNLSNPTFPVEKLRLLVINENYAFVQKPEG